MSTLNIQAKTTESDLAITHAMRSALDAATMKMLDISTSHIPKHTADALGDLDQMGESELYDTLSYVHYHEYGWIIHVSNEEQILESHPELSRLITMTRQLGFQHLKLDCDAPSIEGLPVFNW